MVCGVVYYCSISRLNSASWLNFSEGLCTVIKASVNYKTDNYILKTDNYVLRQLFLNEMEGGYIYPLPLRISF